MMLTRFLFLLPALRLTKNENVPTSSDDYSSWSQRLRIAINFVQVIESVLPVLTYVSRWTQIFSMYGQVTISLIPLAVAKVKEEIQTLHASVVQFIRGADCEHSKKMQAV